MDFSVNFFPVWVFIMYYKVFAMEVLLGYMSTSYIAFGIW